MESLGVLEFSGILFRYEFKPLFMFPWNVLAALLCSSCAPVTCPELPWDCPSGWACRFCKSRMSFRSLASCDCFYAACCRCPSGSFEIFIAVRHMPAFVVWPRRKGASSSLSSISVYSSFRSASSSFLSSATIYSSLCSRSSFLFNSSTRCRTWPPLSCFISHISGDGILSVRVSPLRLVTFTLVSSSKMPVMLPILLFLLSNIAVLEYAGWFRALELS